MEKQVDKKAYDFQKYCEQDRWSSYWHQINDVLKCNPKNVLEIGVGDKVFGDYIKNNTNIKYFCLDIAEDLNPDIIGSVDNMPIENNVYDLVCAFEILEHLPFEKFKKSLDELYRVSKKDVIISLPHWGRHFSIDIRIPYFKRFSWQYKCNFFPIKHKFNGQHYWEIGKKGYSIKRIREEFSKAGFKIIKDYIVFKSPYHHFFVLRK
ncbi:class I SAM-dependent methyltransferase [bacterium]|nr:class I SAM-dependent methyltransferase [bacterium]